MNLTFQPYGLIMALALLATTYLVAFVLSKDHKSEASLVWDGLWFVFVPGLAGARLYHVIDYWSYYQENLDQVVAVWRGGLGIFGAILGGLAGLIFFAHLKKLAKPQLFRLLDSVAMSLPLGQAIGRWGNFVNQELFGPPTDLPWGVFISVENRPIEFVQFSHFHPLFLYESLLSFALLLFGLLLWRRGLGGKGWQLGGLRFLGLYPFGYGLIRFLLEFARLESWQLAGVATAQIVSVAMMLIGLVLLLGKAQKLGLVATAFALVFLGGCSRSSVEPVVSFQVTSIKEREIIALELSDNKLDVELVNTPAKTQLGLSYREEIGSDGMLFDLDRESVPSFWMKGMKFGLDFVWIGECQSVDDKVPEFKLECRVLDLTERVPAPADPDNTTSLKTYSPTKPIRFVLEAPLGTVEQLGINLGDVVKI